MSFPRYPRYKDSGVEWLGEVPEHWMVSTVRRVCTIKKRIAGELGHDVLSITQQGLRVRDLESSDGQLSMDYSKYQIVEVGDFAMNHMDLLTGYIDIAKQAGVTSPDYRVFAVRDPQSCLAPYILYLFQNAYKNKILWAYGQGSSHLGRWRLPTDQFNGFGIPLPPKPEQRMIVAFLDREVAKIDVLITEQQQLIELLKEKRQAVISHVVTRGLDADALMESSGVNWLGDMPAHWTNPPLYMRYEVLLGKMLDEKRITGEHLVPYVRNADVQWDLVRTTGLPEMDIPPQERDRYTLKVGDLLVCEGGEVGRTAVWNGSLLVCGFQKALHRLRPLSKSEHPRYFYYCMRFAAGTGIFIAEGNPNTIPHLTGEKLRLYRFPKPPGNEQAAIGEFLDAESQRFGKLIAEAERAITLLQERRTALISAAVTGKTDVRGLVREDAGAGVTGVG